MLPRGRGSSSGDSLQRAPTSAASALASTGVAAVVVVGGGGSATGTLTVPAAAAAYTCGASWPVDKYWIDRAEQYKLAGLPTCAESDCAYVYTAAVYGCIQLT